MNPYILEVPRSRRVYQQGDVLDFRILLIGDALRYVGDVVGALTQDAWFELGAQRKKFRMMDIIQADQLEPIWRLGTLHMDGAIPERLTAWQQEEAMRCSIHFLTPLRIRRGGVLIRELDFPTIIRNITRRVEALAERYGGYVNPDAAATVNELSGDVKQTSSGLFWYDLKRYSNRRNTKMDLSGLLGAMTFEGDLTIFAPWLHAARVLHIGRNVTFGCGQVEVGLY
ncbi:CRISPR system precrRNA processing endoribonuclease RAMP protein Cas6 [Insulibacter thermoxylanivorax]|uniref:CRISPR system precrRNA processing endoribonuclease RAMP protein Cas6 n=1 Tax=Insulibacter thermoxylanivorax TaxID=2749268 RepID=UPI001F5BF73A|nr:CRISPR system precrRNA processing endoribonuclease RAMP protein Cas6 [Insulibacter thermoxylanivorax]